MYELFTSYNSSETEPITVIGAQFTHIKVYQFLAAKQSKLAATSAIFKILEDNMAESFISSIAAKVLEKLASLAYEEVCLAWGVKADLEKLQEILSTIKAVLLDAEEQQVQSHELRDWLAKLKDACYDAEDVLDEFDVEALRRQVTSQQGIGRKVCRMLSCSNNPLAFRFRMGHKIKAIRERFDEIAALKAKFNLTVRVDDRHVMHRGREMTHSFVLASDIIGREKDKEEIIKLLVQSSDGETVSVIPIVGLGGLGKTALAKLVYNDEMVQNLFELKIWTCVSQDFDIKQLILKILKSICNENCSDLDIEQLQQVLRETLASKRYLLVMDDVWSEDYKIWDEFKALLLGCARGSKILVTTRSNRVASIMGTIKDSNCGYKLEGLPYETCLSLFLKYALKEGQDKQHPNLLKIAEEIVKKCGGIPLAVKTLGSLLYSSTNEFDWLHVKDNEIWKLEQKENDVLPALKLSYDMLPSHLKQCFFYCSIFPKDYVFNNVGLIQFWMAHGLLYARNEYDEIEDIGTRYLKELWSRSFFQDFIGETHVYLFKMHDLIHDLALSISRDEFLIVNNNSQVSSKKVRHLSFVGINLSTSTLPAGKGLLRTIYFPTKDGNQSQSFVESCISRFQFLRVLIIRCSDIKVLPNDIYNLKQLRYLGLSYCPRMKKISNSICKLQSLQTLCLHGCKKLKELPSNLKYLINLRALTVITKEKCLSNYQIGCLNFLRTLWIYECNNLEYLMEDIGQLKLLKRLGIYKCRSLIALPHSIKHLLSLENLFITDCEKLNLNLEMESKGEHSSQDLSAVRLKLRVLMIGGLPLLVELPRWLLQISAQTLQTLVIANCPNLSSQSEDMRHLTALKRLIIDGHPALIERFKQDIDEDWNKNAHILYTWLKHAMSKSSN